jgi:mercuric ion binding protein
MNKLNPAVAMICLVALAAPAAWAASKTVTLNVPGMTCPACPITIKKALSKVDGVSKVEVSYEKKEARVTFDDAKTDTKALVKATTDAGFPSKAESEQK